MTTLGVSSSRVHMFSCESVCMVASVEDVTNTLDGMSWKYIVKEDKNHVLTGVVTDDYLDKDGEHRLGLIIKIVEDGEMLVVAAPFARSVPNLNKTARLALLDLLNEATLNYKLARASWDPADGEVTANVMIPVEQGSFHPSMLERCIGNIVEFFERYGARMDEVLNAPSVVVPEEDELITLTQAEMMDRFMRYQAELEDGV